MKFQNLTFRTKYIPLGNYTISRAGLYQDGSAVLSITRGLEQWSRPTVYVDNAMREVPVNERKNICIIKDYSESEGIAEALSYHEVVLPFLKIRIGFGSGFMCQIKSDLLVL